MKSWPLWLKAIAITVMLAGASSSGAQAPPCCAAPAYHWENVAPYIAVAPPGDATVTLARYGAAIYCDAACSVASSYSIASEKAQNAHLTLLVANPQSIQIDLAGRQVIPGEKRQPSEKDWSNFRFKGKIADYLVYPSAIDIVLPLIPGANELAIKETVQMSTRGRQTEKILRMAQLYLHPVRLWSLGDDFSAYLSFAFGPAVLTPADGLKDGRFEWYCEGSDPGDFPLELPAVGYHDDATGRAIFPMLFRFNVPHYVRCVIASHATLKDEALVTWGKGVRDADR
jgi:hypothetical protein